MVDTMRAQRFYADTKTIAVEDVPIPEPGPGEVLVKVAFCGICHSDLSLINGTFPSQLPVVTQGHEASGTVAKLGPGRHRLGRGRPRGGRRGPAVPGVRELPARRRVELPAHPADGVRLRRRAGRSTPWHKRSGSPGFPTTCPLEQAAILADAVSTPYGAVVRTGKVGIGESVGVWGVGGLGTHMVQLARLVGAAPIIAVDIKPAILDRALAVGADYAFDARDADLPAKIAEATGGRKLDVAFDAVGLEVDVRAGA